MISFVWDFRKTEPIKSPKGQNKEHIFVHIQDSTIEHIHHICGLAFLIVCSLKFQFACHLISINISIIIFHDQPRMNSQVECQI